MPSITKGGGKGGRERERGRGGEEGEEGERGLGKRNHLA